MSNFLATLFHLSWRDLLRGLSPANLKQRVKALSRNQAIAVGTLLAASVITLTPEQRRQESARVLDEARSSELAAHGTKTPIATQAAKKAAMAPR